MAESILDEAKRLTSGDRQNDYDHPAKNFARVAKMWNGVLADKLNAKIEPRDIPLCMICIKLARQARKHKRDNLVDIAGYARTVALLEGEE